VLYKQIAFDRLMNYLRRRGGGAWWRTHAYFIDIQRVRQLYLLWCHFYCFIGCLL